MSKFKLRNADSAAVKPCRVCGTSIAKDARRCLHCTSWQDSTETRRYIYTTVLPLLVALLSVTVAAVPVFERALVPEKSIISAVFQTSTEKYITVLVSNEGGRPGSIRYGYLEIKGNYGDWRIALNLETSDRSGALAIPRQDSVLARLFRAPDGHAYHRRRGSNGNMGDEEMNLNDYGAMEIIGVLLGDCRLIFSYSNFDGQDSESSQAMPCRQINTFLHRNLDNLKFRDLSAELRQLHRSTGE